jgi:hypothetical protein
LLDYITERKRSLQVAAFAIKAKVETMPVRSGLVSEVPPDEPPQLCRTVKVDISPGQHAGITRTHLAETAIQKFE